MERSPGYYAGTVIGGRWWRRYRKRDFFARGSGKYWFEAEAFCFLRTLTANPLCIPYGLIQRIEVGTTHAGRWIWGRPIVKVLWQDDGQVLSSGFAIPHGAEGTERFIEALRARLS
jgi:hypothetical protein